MTPQPDGTVAVLPELVRPLLDGRLPGWVEPRWFASTDQMLALAPGAEIGWFDGVDLSATSLAAQRAARLRWLNTVSVGIDAFPLHLFRERDVVLTNGAGLNVAAVAEYAVMGMLTIAKGWRQVVRAQDRHEWLTEAPGKAELYGSRALIVGAGGVGGRIGALLRALGVAVVEVRRTPAPGVLGRDEWRPRLGDFDWVIVAVPSTDDTAGLIGATELAAMRPTAAVVNVARGSVIDQRALTEALQAGTIGAAFLDVTDPEPLPADDPLWSLDNAHISMHLAGRSQATLFRRATERFLANLERYERLQPLSSVVDLIRGY